MLTIIPSRSIHINKVYFWHPTRHPDQTSHTVLQTSIIDSLFWLRKHCLQCERAFFAHLCCRLAFWPSLLSVKLCVSVIACLFGLSLPPQLSSRSGRWAGADLPTRVTCRGSVRDCPRAEGVCHSRCERRTVIISAPSHPQAQYIRRGLLNAHIWSSQFTV